MKIIATMIIRNMINVSKKMERLGAQVQVRTKDKIKVVTTIAIISFIERNLLGGATFASFD